MIWIFRSFVQRSVIFLMLLTWVGCADTFYWTESFYLFPTWSLSDTSDVYEGRYQVKTFFKYRQNQENKLSFRLFNRSSQQATGNIKISLVDDEGRLAIDGTEVNSQSVFLVQDKMSLLVEFFPPIRQDKTYSLTFQNLCENHEEEIITTVQIEAFQNKLPTASFKITPLQGEHEYMLDASLSVDGDEGYGGGIVGYSYTIQKEGDDLVKKFMYTSAHTPYVFPTEGVFIVQLVIVDNDDASSDPVYHRIVISE